MKGVYPVLTLGVPLVLVLVALATPWDDTSLGLPLSGDVGRPTRWLTYMFVHISPAHLMANLTVAPFLFLCEVVHGRGRTVAVALIAGLTAALWMRSGAPRHGVLLGFSGCAYGVIGFVLAFVLLNLDEFRRPLLWVGCAVSYVALEVVVAQLWTTSGGVTIAHLAHFGGAWQGVCIGVVVGRNLTVRSHEKVVRIVCGAGGAAAIAVPLAFALL